MASGSTPSSPAPSSPVAGDHCTICLLDLSPSCGRTVVTLRCSHTFHLDCIGSAFNTKRAMECPNCRAIEAGQWNLHVRRPMPTQDRSGQVSEEMPEATSQMQVPEYQWCPNHGWGWSTHTTHSTQVDETDECVVTDDVDDLRETVDRDGRHQNVQQQNSDGSSTADASQVPDLDSLPVTVFLHIGHDGTPMDVDAHNDRAHLRGSATGSAVQINSTAGISSGSLSESELDFLSSDAVDALDALEALRTPRLRTNDIALPVQGTSNMFEKGETSDPTVQNQDRAALSGSNVRDMEVMSSSEPAAAEGHSMDPDEENAAAEGDAVGPDQ